MGLFENRKIEGITKRVLNLFSESAKDAHPKEFAAGMREIDGIISELIMVPGTVSGPRSAILKLRTLPVDFSIVGVIHSHPSSSYNPSRGDMITFGKYGRLHIIMGYPYNLDSWQAYDNTGKKVDLDIIE